MSLLKTVKTVLTEPNKSLLVGKGCTLNIDDLIVFQKKLAAIKAVHSVTRIALYSLGNLDTAKLITVLDGMFDTVFLVPGDISEGACVEYCKMLDIDIVFQQESFITNELLTLTVEDVMEFDVASDGVEFQCETRWVLMTSGTTGSSKLVSHTMASLTNTVKKKTKYSDNIWGLFYSPYRFAGIQVLLQSLLSANTLVISETCNSLSDTVKLFIDKEVNSLSATPTIWRKVLMTKGAELIPLEVITLGGEIVDQNILNALKKAYCRARLIHIYASTEAGSGFSVTDSTAGFPKNYINNNSLPFDLGISQQSTLLIKSKSSAHGYLGDAAFPVNEEGYIDTGDLVELINDRYFFKGRENGSINVGGLKVHPEEVESILLSHPLVQLAAVSAKKNPITGALVTAQLVLVEHEFTNKEVIADIQTFCRDKLEPHKVPALMRITDDININSTGKTVR